MVEVGKDDNLRECLELLQGPIEKIEALLNALCAPLEALGVLPSKYKRYVGTSIQPGSRVTDRHISRIQVAVLQQVLSAWEPELKRQGFADVLDYWLCPPYDASSKACSRIAIEAHTTTLSSPLNASSIQYLVRLVQRYPIHHLHEQMFDGVTMEDPKLQLRWEDLVRNVASIPAKAANASASQDFDLPVDLEQGSQFQQFCKSTEEIVHAHCKHWSKVAISSITTLLSKLVRLDVFRTSPSYLPSQTSFFQTTLPTIRTRLGNDAGDVAAEIENYAMFWSTLLSSLGSVIATQTITSSLIGHLDLPPSSQALDSSSTTRRLLKREASLIRLVIGNGKDKDSYAALASVALARDWDERHARVFVCFLSSKGVDGAPNDHHAGLEVLYKETLEVWTSPTHVKHSLLSKHRYMTALLLLAVFAFSPDLSPVNDLALDPSFIKSIGMYIGVADPSVRRCGMLLAEAVAQRAGKKLAFDGWDGDHEELRWCRALRELVEMRDTDVALDIDEAQAAKEEVKSKGTTSSTLKIVDSDDEDETEPVSRSRTQKSKVKDDVPADTYDSDDSLTGYASEDPSSRAPSPTPSELEEIEKDPSLNVGVKKIARPVYLVQLGQLLWPTTISQGEDEGEADRIQMGLDSAEELIRRKKDYGTELEENAINLGHGLVALVDNFELEGFNEKRQAAVVALVACSPKKTAPALIELLFINQYSMEQRFLIMNALALGARELAGLPVPQSKVAQERIAFPSKRLPPAQDQKYITAEDHWNANAPVQQLIAGISRDLLANTAESSSQEPPQIARERQLRLRQPAKVSIIPPHLATNALFEKPTQKPRTTFMSVATEYFIHPLIARFWLFLRDEQTREERTANLPELHQYRSAGTGLLLSANILSHFLGTLGVLMHAGRNAPAWGAVLAPDALEVAATMGNRRISLLDDQDDDTEVEPIGPQREGKNTHAMVLGAALELALVVLDGAIDLDGGRVLGLEHTQLLIGVGEWAAKVFEAVEKGEKLKGGGGAQEMRLVTTAAGVCLKVEQISKKWGRAMVRM